MPSRVLKHRPSIYITPQEPSERACHGAGRRLLQTLRVPGAIKKAERASVRVSKQPLSLTRAVAWMGSRPARGGCSLWRARSPSSSWLRPNASKRLVRGLTTEEENRDAAAVRSSRPEEGPPCCLASSRRACGSRYLRSLRVNRSIDRDDSA